MKKVFFSLLILIGAVVFNSVFAYFSPGMPTGFVNDYADLLNSEQKNNLEQKLSQFEKETSNEISVVTIQNMQGDTIENFAVKLFEEWGIGKKDKDNGILILVAKDERKMRIEVGYGLEGALTDAQSFWIIDQVMKPAFRNNDYYGGLNEATDKIMSSIKGEFQIPQQDSASTFDELAPAVILAVFFIIWLSLFFLRFLGVLSKSKSWWGGGIAGGVIALIVGLVFTSVSGFVSALILIPLGLWLDYTVSRRYTVIKEASQPLPWWIGGRGGSGFGGGGFGGFGGGRSGGGGSSGSW